MTVVGVNTFAYANTTPVLETVRRLSGIGYRSFELVVQPPQLPLRDYDAASRRELSGLLSTLDPVHCSLNLPSLDHNMASPWREVRDFTVDMFKQAVDLASDLAVPNIVVVPGRLSPFVPASPESRTKRLRDCVERVLDYAQPRGVGLAIENVPMGAFPDAISLGAFVRGFASPEVGVCFDVANAHFYRESPAAGLRQVADVLRIVHVSDTTQEVWKHDPVGTGTVPFGEVPAVFDEIGYDGVVMIEILDPDPEAAIIRSHDLLTKVGFPSRPERPMSSTAR